MIGIVATAPEQKATEVIAEDTLGQPEPVRRSKQPGRRTMNRKRLSIIHDTQCLSVSRVVMGMYYPSPAFAKFDAYVEAGGNTFDCARCYFDSEKLLGQWVRERGNRDSVVVCTKGGCTDFTNGVKRIRPLCLYVDLSDSLNALQTDYVDIYFLHRDDVTVPVGSIMETLHQFVRSGKVRFLGASNWTTDRIAAANAYALENGLTPFSVSQPCWSLAYTDAAHFDPELAYMTDAERRWYLESKLPVMAHSALANGYLSLDRFIPTNGRYGTFPVNRIRYARAHGLAAQLGVSVTEVVIGYITCNPVNAAAIVGWNSAAHERECLGGLRVELTPEQVAYLHGGGCE
jgi:aryl-alcohol dehydrogenase-like predicted oxidoreductase